MIDAALFVLVVGAVTLALAVDIAAGRWLAERAMAMTRGVGMSEQILKPPYRQSARDRKIFEQRKAGRKYRDIGARFGLSAFRVGEICRRIERQREFIRNGQP